MTTKRYKACTCCISGIANKVILQFGPARYGTTQSAPGMLADSNDMSLCSPSTVIDATRTGNDARYMGYSKQPSCQCQKWIVDDQPRAFMVALKDLVPGEELTFDSSSKCNLSPQVK